MNDLEQKLNYENLRREGTGAHVEETQINTKIIGYPFGRYNIKVQLSENNEFLGIEEIELMRDFLSDKQKISFVGRELDLKKIYPDE